MVVSNPEEREGSVMFGQAISRFTSLMIPLAVAISSQAQQVLGVFPSSLFPDDVARVAAALAKLGNSVDGVIVLNAWAEDGTATAFNFGTDPDALKRARVTPRTDWSGAVEFRGKDWALLHDSNLGRRLVSRCSQRAGHCLRLNCRLSSRLARVG